MSGLPLALGQPNCEVAAPGAAVLEGDDKTGLRHPANDDTSSPAMRDNIRLVSSEGTGFTYYTTKNKKKQQGKLELKKYDPVLRRHVVFKEAKMPPHSK
jgi:large subunit ribosomal protein L33